MRALAAIAGKHNVNFFGGVSGHRWPYHGNKGNGKGGNENLSSKLRGHCFLHCLDCSNTLQVLPHGSPI